MSEQAVKVCETYEFEGPSWPIGYQAKGKHDPAAFIKALEETFGFTCPPEAVEHNLMRCMPTGESGRFCVVYADQPGRGTFTVTEVEMGRLTPLPNGKCRENGIGVWKFNDGLPDWVAAATVEEATAFYAQQRLTAPSYHRIPEPILDLDAEELIDMDEDSETYGEEYVSFRDLIRRYSTFPAVIGSADL